MFSLRFAVLTLFILGIYGQQQNDNFNPSENVEKGYPFGRLRVSDDGKKEELISGNPNEKNQVQQDQTKNVQPLPSPCVGARSLTKLAYPGDKTKYIYCRDEFHYEIFSCPNNGEFNEQRATCDIVVPVLDRCTEEKPCLNDGQCTLLSNSTFKCTCRPDWTGDRCETPINSCVRKPCGPNAECRVLKTNDYDQDYVCVCHAKKGYGLNCQEAVPNPCLKGTEQYFPYAFSQHAYIQCDGEVIYFQPCGPLLYWNQEEKICDRKRPPKLDIPTIIKKYGGHDDNEDYDDEEESTTRTTTTTTTTLSPAEESQTEPTIRFIPAKVPHRQQGLFSQNEQPTQSVRFNQLSQDSQPTSNQWTNRPWSHTPSKPVQQNRQWDNQQQFQDQAAETTTTSTTTTPKTVTLPSSQGRNFQSWPNQPTNQWNNNQGAQSQSWQTQPTNQWNSNQGVPSQSWQTQPGNQWNNHQGVPAQPWQNVQGAGGVQQPVFPTTTPSPVNVPSWQHQSNNQWNTNQGVPSQSWQNVQGIGGQQSLFTTTTIASPVNVPSWQTQPTNQWNNHQGVPSQSWQNGHGNGNQQWSNNQWNTNQGAQSQTWQNGQGTGNQQWSNNQWNANQGGQAQPWQKSQNSVTQQPILPLTTTTTTTTTTSPSTVNATSWQDQPTNQVAQSFQDQAQSEFPTTTTTTTQSNVVLKPNPSWQTKPSNQWNSNSPTIGFQPQQTINNRPLTQSWQNYPTVSTLQPILPLTTTTPQTNVFQNNQWNNNQMSQTMGLTQHRPVLPIQKSFDQTPSWSQNNMNTQSMMDQHKTSDTGVWNNNRAY